MLTPLVGLILVILSYVMGSLCSAVIVCKLCHLPDPRLEGSRNPGTTNVLRLAGKKYAIIVLLADMLKGFLPVFIVKYSHWAPGYIGVIGLAAVLGHMYPVFFKFKGGKGVATVLGVLFGFDLMIGVTAVISWVIVAMLTKYSSLAAIIVMIFAPLDVWLMTKQPALFYSTLIVSLLILYQHRENIRRLMNGTESKIKLSSSKSK